MGVFWREMHAWMCEEGYRTSTLPSGTKYPKNTSCEFVICTDFSPYILPIPAFGYFLLGISTVGMIWYLLLGFYGCRGVGDEGEGGKEYVIVLPWVVLEQASAVLRQILFSCGGRSKKEDKG